MTVAGGAHAQNAPACQLETIGTATVRTVIDGRTLILTDGREVRLAAIETPEAEPGHAGGAEAAKAELEAFAGGKDIILKRHGPATTDRHRRLLAYAFAAEDRPSAQHALVSAGLARAGSRIGSAGCAAELFAAERTARAAGIGLWGDPHYVMRRAEDPAGVLAQRGRFAVVEGKVVSVREAGATIYVNFGRRWSEDFTVTVQKRSERAFTAAGLELRKLGGRHVRVRGTIEERGGPWIEATRPEQIEIADGH